MKDCSTPLLIFGKRTESGYPTGELKVQMVTQSCHIPLMCFEPVHRLLSGQGQVWLILHYLKIAYLKGTNTLNFYFRL